MISRDTLDRVFAAAKIEEVVGDYISLKRRGANLIGLCPFHNEKTGSFTVSPAKGIYKCFGCGKAGRSVDFVKDIEQCSFSEAVKMLARKYHIPYEEREQTEEEKIRQDNKESMFVVNEFSNRWFQQQIWETEEGRMAGLGYLIEKRGIHEDIIRLFQLGYSPERSALAGALRKQGFQEEFVVNDPQNEPHWGTGVCLKGSNGELFDRFRGRVMFPFFSSSGKVTGFAGRIIKANDKAGKYVNSPTSPIYEKHNELYGYFQAKAYIQREKMCYLVEGQLDVISLVQAGIRNVVSSGGTSLTIPQIRLIHRFTNNLTILYDGDKAGIKAAQRGIDMALAEGMNVRVVLLPEGQDPDEFARTHNASELLEYIHANQVDFIRFKIGLLSEDASSDPTLFAEMVNEVIGSIAKIPEIVTRQVYLKMAAEMFEMDERTLGFKLRDVRRDYLKKEEQAARPRLSIHPNQPQNSAEQSPEQEAEENTGAATEAAAADTESAAPAATSAPTEPTPPAKKMTAEEKQQAMLLKNYENIIQAMIRYGERPYRALSDEEKRLYSGFTIGGYLLTALQADQIMPPAPIFERFIDEYIAHCNEEAFVAETYFIQHPDYELSQLALRLVVDRYQLSSMYSHQTISDNVQVERATRSSDEDLQISQLAKQLVQEMKLTVINQRLDEVQKLLREAIQQHDDEMVRGLLAGKNAFMAMRMEICKELGNRVMMDGMPTSR